MVPELWGARREIGRLGRPGRRLPARSTGYHAPNSMRLDLAGWHGSGRGCTVFGDSRFSTNRKRDGWLLLLAQASRLQLFQANRVHANRPALSPPAYPTKTTTTHIAKGGVRKNMELPPRPTLGAMTKAERFISYRGIEWLARDIDEAVNIQFPTSGGPSPRALRS